MCNVQKVDRTVAVGIGPLRRNRPRTILIQVIDDGKVAIDRLDETEPYLIVLDLHLPNVPGDKILDYIIKQDHLKDVRVIIASADGQLADFQGFKNKSQLMIMQKPVSFDQLTLLSRRLLQA